MLTFVHLDSWAITPYLMKPVMDNIDWKIPSIAFPGEWDVDHSFDIRCSDGNSDGTIFFEGSMKYAPALTGFYVRRYQHSDTSDSSAIYSHIKSTENDVDQYLFKFQSNWMIGSIVGVDSGLAFVDDPALLANEISSNRWHFVSETSWVEDPLGARLYTSYSTANNVDIYQILRYLQENPSSFCHPSPLSCLHGA